MALHFTRAEFTRRQKAACREIRRRGLDGLLCFRQESMYWLTGYDTNGFSLFQGMYLGADGRIALCTRAADRLQSKYTSVIKDVRIWIDREGATPAHDLRDMLESYGCRGKRLGVEYDAYGLTGARAKMVDAAFEGFCRTEEATDIIRLLRMVKSPAELVYVRKAGTLADDARDVAVRDCVPGASIAHIYGDMLGAIMAGDGDPTAARWPIGAGQEALFVRYHTGHKPVSTRNDQSTFEFAASYRHYHTVMMFVVLTGKVDPRHRGMFQAARDALDAAEGDLRPGKTVGDVFNAQAKVLKGSRYARTTLPACGYTVGANFPPTWMDGCFIHAGNPQVLEPGMVFFKQIMLLDDRTGLSMSLGETSVVTARGCERVCHAPRELIAN
jgi:Xaa-Pro dipeptidase